MSQLIRDQIRNRVRHHRSVNRAMERMRSREQAYFLAIEQNSNQQTNEEDEIGSIDKLRSWAIQYNISQRAVTALLKILISIGFKWLPSDSRALLKTPRVVDLEDCAGGKLWYRGIRTSIQSILKHATKDYSLTLNFNFDGTVLFNSSAWNFWPILASINGILYLKCNQSILSWIVYFRNAQYTSYDSRCLVWDK